MCIRKFVFVAATAAGFMSTITTAQFVAPPELLIVIPKEPVEPTVPLLSKAKGVLEFLKNELVPATTVIGFCHIAVRPQSPALVAVSVVVPVVWLVKVKVFDASIGLDCSTPV